MISFWGTMMGLSISGTEQVCLFAHHPIIDCGTVMDRTLSFKQRDRIERILIESGKNIHIFCGHYHFEDMTVKENITQYVTPACIMQIRSDNKANEIKTDSFDFGYRIINITPETVITETKRSPSEREVLPGE